MEHYIVPNSVDIQWTLAYDDSGEESQQMKAGRTCTHGAMLLIKKFQVQQLVLTTSINALALCLGSPELSDNKCLSFTLYHRILKLFVEGTALRIYPS